MTEGFGDNSRGGMGSQVTLEEAGRLITGKNSFGGGNWNSYHSPKLPHQMGNQNQGKDTSRPLECGFYWYRNTALYRHKGVVSHSGGGAGGGDRGGDRGGVPSDHASLLEKMTALCNNKDDSLTELCADILGSDFKTSDSN